MLKTVIKSKYSPFPKNRELLAPIDTADQIILWNNFILHKTSPTRNYLNLKMSQRSTLLLAGDCDKSVQASWQN